MAVNPLQMILAEPVTAFQQGREAGAMARQRERMEAEQTRALEQRNKLQELYAGIGPDTDPEAVIRQAGMTAGMEGEQQFRDYFGQRDQAAQAKVQARNEGVARIIAEIDRMPPQQQEQAYQQFAAKLPPEWQGLPYAQARGRAIALITPADKLFAQSTAKVPTSIQEFQYAQQNPDYMQYRQTLAQAGARPQYGNYQGTPIQFTPQGFVPVGQAGASPTPQPQVDAITSAIAEQANRMIQSGIPPEQVEAWAGEQMQANRPQGMQVEGLPSRGTIYELDAPPIEVSAKIKGVWAGLTPDQRRQAVEQEAGIRPKPKSGEEGGIPGISSKDATTARLKLNQVQTARQQLERVKQQFAAIQNTLSAGGFGQGMVPTESGQQFDRAVAQLNPLITAITRVPGVGAMSDYETRLQQAAMPARGNYESTTIEQLQGIEQMLNQVEEGYRTLLNQPAKGAPASDIDALLDKYK
jgi:hypothetical protein